LGSGYTFKYPLKIYYSLDLLYFSKFLPPQSPPTYLSIDSAMRVKTDTATERKAIKLLTVQYQEPNGQFLKKGEKVLEKTST
jgi:hypothetical protein